MSKPPKLFEHQAKSIKYYIEHNEVFDMSDPGTGKTRVALESLRHNGDTALVLAPKSLLRSAWEDDALRFTPDLKVSVAYAENRAKAFNAKADIYVTNIDGAKWLAEQPTSFFRRFNQLVIDEISYYKHATSQRSKAINKIKKHFQRRYGLSGTPASNTVLDLWHPTFILDNGQRLGTSFFAFRSAVCTPVQIGPRANMVKWVDREGAEAAIVGRLSDMTIRHKLEECLDMPEQIVRTVKFHMSPKHRALYNKLRHEAMILVEQEQVSAINAAVLVTKLLQAASGAVYNDAGGSTLLDSGRYELITDLVAEREHSVVFFQWVHQRDALLRCASAAGIRCAVIDGSISAKQRTEVVRHFQDGWYQCLLIQPQSGAHGLTLTRATTAIWASPTYNLEHWLQGNRRIYRAGQTKRTEIITVLADDSIDERVYAASSDKNVRQTSLLDLIRR